MKKIQILFFTLLLCLLTTTISAQEQSKISGKVLSTHNTPIKGAVVSVTGSDNVNTDEKGTFQIDVRIPRRPIFLSGQMDITRFVSQ